MTRAPSSDESTRASLPGSGRSAATPTLLDRAVSAARRWGTLYALGLGPGDPELITVKAQRIMRAVPTLILPVRRPCDTSYAWTIAAPHLEPGRQRVVRLPFPQQSGEDALDAQWAHNARQTLDLLADGQDAAFLTEGDPLLYGSFVHLAAQLRAADQSLPIQIVPGVSSITAAAAAVGGPLVSRGERLAVLPAIYSSDDLRRTLREFDTVVLLKIHRVLESILEVLEDVDLAQRAVLVEHCGRPDQRIVRDVRSLSG